ncbi:tyrosine-type recombinase/integrase [Hymenobacter cheonanensis]|uniref:tyrosine-type recombinase/integrase n=1 Tax=Hymenobacter sp. CA2-7 TaxID=3063993 RepID=UPI0027123A0F|nr:tyrosine-type recombinase/integrase [Hymenobacter sp. CA2-7]MDO7887602.1 tyrosine-type recombinase/integrase [Hymenobacter sp. CA2-7]
MKQTLQERFPRLFLHPQLSKWLTIQFHQGLAPATIDAYARALLDYADFCRSLEVDFSVAQREHIAAYVHNMASRPVGKGGVQQGLANATMRQRLVAVRLCYDYLVEEQLRDDNPIKRGVYTVNKGFAGSRRGLLPHHKRLPWIPDEEQWQNIVTATDVEPLRNRLMLALAYDGALRREELCLLHTGDFDIPYRLITLRAETSKTRRSRVVHYSEATGQLYAMYLRQRFKTTKQGGLLFLSESHRNEGSPLTKWTWSKVVHAIAARAGVSQFTTHTLRHLRLTDLARAGLELHEIATFAGHKSLDTTTLYIHLSGRELADKVSKGMNAIHIWRTATINNLPL